MIEEILDGMLFEGAFFRVEGIQFLLVCEGNLLKLKITAASALGQNAADDQHIVRIKAFDQVDIDVRAVQIAVLQQAMFFPALTPAAVGAVGGKGINFVDILFAPFPVVHPLAVQQVVFGGEIFPILNGPQSHPAAPFPAILDGSFNVSGFSFVSIQLPCGFHQKSVQYGMFFHVELFCDCIAIHCHQSPLFVKSYYSV